MIPLFVIGWLLQPANRIEQGESVSVHRELLPKHGLFRGAFLVGQTEMQSREPTRHADPLAAVAAPFVEVITSRDRHPVSIPPITLTLCCDTVQEVADVAVKIHVQSDPTNVAVTLQLDGPHSQFSEIPISDRQPATFWPRPYQRLGPGVYEVTAILWRHDQRTYEAGRALARVRVGPLPD